MHVDAAWPTDLRPLPDSHILVGAPEPPSQDGNRSGGAARTGILGDTGAWSEDPDVQLAGVHRSDDGDRLA